MKKTPVVILALLVIATCCCAAEPADRPASAVTAPAAKSDPWNPGLDGNEQQTLLAVARSSLKWCIEGKTNAFTFDGFNLTPKLREPIATIVVLKTGNDVRGRAGGISAGKKPVYQSVHDNVVKAADGSGGTNAVTMAESAGMRISIALVGAVRPIQSVDSFNVGEHGIVLERGVRSASFLPDEPVQHGWNKEQTMEALSRLITKGTVEDWRRGARYKIFYAVVLSE
jgi:AMMECR1 domain-containing protein